MVLFDLLICVLRAVSSITAHRFLAANTQGRGGTNTLELRPLFFFFFFCKGVRAREQEEERKGKEVKR